jgi:DNA primase
MVQKADYSIGCCPIHEDNNPSFVVYNDSEYYHCWACDPTGGDVIQLYMKVYDCSFADAVTVVCEGGDKEEELRVDCPTDTKVDDQELYAVYVRKLFEKFSYSEVVEADKRARHIIDKYNDYKLGINILNANLFKFEETV